MKEIKSERYQDVESEFRFYEFNQDTYLIDKAINGAPPYYTLYAMDGDLAKTIEVDGKSHRVMG